MSSDRHPRSPKGPTFRIPNRLWPPDPDRDAPPSAQALAGSSGVASAAGTISATPISASDTQMLPSSSARTSSAAPSSPAPSSSAHRPNAKSSVDCTAPNASTAPSAPTSPGVSLRRRNPRRAATKGTAAKARADPPRCRAKSGPPSSTKSLPNAGNLLSGVKENKHVSDRMEKDLTSKSLAEPSHSSIAKEKEHLRDLKSKSLAEQSHSSNTKEKEHLRDLKSKSLAEQSHSSNTKKLQKVISLHEKERCRKIEKARESYLRILKEIDTEHTSSLMAVLDEAMQSPDVAVVYHDEMLCHIPPDNSHPEKPGRYSGIMERVRDEKILNRCELFEASPASLEVLLDLDVHTQNYLNSVNTLSSMLREGVESMVFPNNDDMYVSKGTTKAAFLAAGAAIKACELVVAGPFMSSFAVVRPPGHHVHKDGPSSGYSFINNVAAAAQYALKKHHMEKILILDFDIHHGDGTENIFLKDKRVLFFSIHRYGDGFFPGSGTLEDIGDDAAAGFNINFCCKKGVGDSDYIAVWDSILLPIVKEFNPELVLISCGFDAAPGDTGECFVTAQGFAYLLQKLTDHPIVMVLEGGYNLPANSDSTAACLGVLLGDKIDAVDISKPPLAATKGMIETTRRALMQYWKCFQ